MFSLTTTVFTVALFIPLTLIAVWHFAAKPNIKAWSSRGMMTIEKNWAGYFIKAGIIAVITVFLVYWFTSNLLAALIVGFLVSITGIGVQSDLITRKIPIEISEVVFIGAIIFFIAALIIQPEPLLVNLPHAFLPTIYSQTALYLLLIGIVMAGIALVLIIRLQSFPFAPLVILLGLGAFLAAYVTVSFPIIYAPEIAGFLNGFNIPITETYVANIGLMLRLIVVTITPVFFLDLVAGDSIGGGDLIALYSLVFALGWWIPAEVFFYGFFAGCLLQALFHLNEGRKSYPTFGERREVPLRGLKRRWTYWRIRTAGIKAGTPVDEIIYPSTYTAVALPFLPALVFSIIGAVLWACIQYGGVIIPAVTPML